MALGTAIAMVAVLAMGQASAKKKGEPPATLRVGDEAVFRLVGDEADDEAMLRKAGVVDGDSAVLLVLSGSAANEAVDNAVMRYFAEVTKAGDRFGIGKLIETGRAVRIRGGARVLALKRGEGTTLREMKTLGGLPTGGRGVVKIRILDGPEAGKVAWCCIRNLARPPR